MYVRHQGPLIEIQTPAKINLFLEILARRPDGFHELETLMVPISIFDTLRFSAAAAAQIAFTCDWAVGLRSDTADISSSGHSTWEAIPTGPDNLVVKTLERLRVRAGVEAGATVRLVKRIPAAAGLGGASSDAAAALVGANQLWNLRWSRTRLAEIAAEMGSDVPFFLGDGAAICRGRGERLEPAGPLPQLHLVVVRPPAGLATAEVYRHCRPAETPRRVADLLLAASSGGLEGLGRQLFNRLQPPAETLSPWVVRLRGVFEQLDCVGHQMSGSGTSYFGICRHARHARRVATHLRGAGWKAVYQATTCGPAGQRVFAAAA